MLKKQGERKRLITFLFFSISLSIAIIQCTEQQVADVRGRQYARRETCVQCHQDIAKSYLHNAHFNTSKALHSPHTTDSMGIDSGTFVFNEKTKVGIERRSSGLYQVAYVNGENLKEERADIVFGAGKSAYTFAFWYGNKLMQMPLNYLVPAHEWVNSPGFPSEQIYFGRAIITRCLECHSSFVQSKIISSANFQLEEEFVKNSLIAGIDCQRCHGPAAQHVQFHQEHPTEKEAKYMVKYGELSRSQKVDMCAVCHSGTNLKMLNSAFFFKPGDTISNLPEYTSYTGEDPDVHGKQKQLLIASKCYQLSNLDCGTCHNIHGAQAPTLATYSQSCIGCHQDVSHAFLEKKALAMVKENCIDCHMPVKASKDIGFQRSASKKKLPYKQRTHRIAIY